MSRPLDVLVVEDDATLREVLVRHLRADGFSVRSAADGTEAIAQCRELTPDIAVLDVSLPGVSGLDVCQHLRSGYTPSPGVLMVTARGAEIDVILGLEVGADDYVVKPCRPREVVARVRALARRVRPDFAGATPADVVELGALRIERAAMRVAVGGAEVKLTATEYALLVELTSRVDVVHTRTELLRKVWDSTHGGYARNVDCHMARLRKKLDAAGLQPSPIHTVHGAGYRFERPEPR